MRDRDNYFDAIGDRTALELTFCFYHVFYPAVRVWFDDSLNPYEWFDLRGKSVGHEIKLTIGWDKRNGAVVLKTSQADTLMKFDVF
mmetsp:Transcript_32678/g.101141  ORF Transcript_32678/g.101141 Transcript_32678/m.101141 type:complete len:86 (-) Transcript_32678:857-1114(-)